MCQSQNKEVGIKCLYICSEVIRRKELDLVEMYTTTLDDKRFYSQILPKLSIHQSMTHLKRVHRGRILLGPVKEFEESDTRSIMIVVFTLYVPGSCLKGLVVDMSFKQVRFRLQYPQPEYNTISVRDTGQCTSEQTQNWRESFPALTFPLMSFKCSGN